MSTLSSDLHRLLSGEGLPALDGDLAVTEIDLEGVAAAAEQLGGDERRAEELVADKLAAAQVVGDRASYRATGFWDGWSTLGSSG